MLLHHAGFFFNTDMIAGMKIISWNVNGIRAVLKKDFLTWVDDVKADVICLQETKADERITIRDATKIETTRRNE